jgi:hypothetical protein
MVKMAQKREWQQLFSGEIDPFGVLPSARFGDSTSHHISGTRGFLHGWNMHGEAR